MHLFRALSALLAASAFAACSASAAAPGAAPAPSRTPVPEATVAPPLSDARIARRAVIRSSDFPRGWKVETATGDRIRCRTTTAARTAASGFARSRTFALGQNTEAEGAAYVYAKRAGAERHFDALRGSGLTGCLTREVKRAFATAGGFTVGAITTAPLEPGAVGDERAGTRITVPVSRQGVDANVLIDVVVVRVGRALSLGVFVDALTEFDSGFRAKLTATQVRRLRADL